mmetsp:Transcript_17349/g.48332  ORF Transcript_17349/g.48332 Transcript_17349/m.48332 type:complete len:301 (-) Transcript_17349:431-1333(-)
MTCLIRHGRHRGGCTACFRAPPPLSRAVLSPHIFISTHTRCCYSREGKEEEREGEEERERGKRGRLLRTWREMASPTATASILLLPALASALAAACKGPMLPQLGSPRLGGPRCLPDTALLPGRADAELLLAPGRTLLQLLLPLLLPAWPTHRGAAWPRRPWPPQVPEVAHDASNNILLFFLLLTGIVLGDVLSHKQPSQVRVELVEEVRRRHVLLLLLLCLGQASLRCCLPLLGGRLLFPLALVCLQGEGSPDAIAQLLVRGAGGLADAFLAAQRTGKQPVLGRPCLQEPLLLLLLLPL